MTRAALVMLTLCLAAPQTVAPAPITDPESYAVYKSLMLQQWPVRVAKAKQLLFSARTSTTKDCMPTGRPMETDWKDVVDDFKRQNASPRRLQSGFDIGIPYRVLTETEERRAGNDIADMFSARPTDFDREFPGYGRSIVNVSAVGFDRDRRRALLSVGHYCGSLCAEFRFYLMEKVNDRWQPANPPGIQICMIVS